MYDHFFSNYLELSYHAAGFGQYNHALSIVPRASQVHENPYCFHGIGIVRFTALRSELSPRHVPDRIEAVPAVPRTLSGKKLEVPVKRILSGTPADQAASRGSLADPTALDHFEARTRPAP